MTFGETMEWQRTQAHNISRLAKLGDKLAKQLVLAYRALYDNRLNPILQHQWMRICDDYVRRDLTLVTRVLLQDRFGHKIPRQLRRLDS